MRVGSSRRAGGRLPVAAVFFAVLVAGCAGRRGQVARPITPPVGPVGDDLPCQNAYPCSEALTVHGLAAIHGKPADPVPGLTVSATQPDRPLSVLVLSGGGKYSAFNAGLLAGWTESGTRPTFDVVTGISSGALSSIFAFLGPKYDARLSSMYLAITRDDLFRVSPVRNLVNHHCLATHEPLRDRIGHEVNDETLADLRRAHAEGRRLFVATAELLSQKLVVWDLGALASSGRPDAGDTVRKVLLAASSIPGWTPPVEFDVEVDGKHYTEWHADGGNFTEAFVQTAQGLPPGSNVFVMTAGKLYRDPLTDYPKFLGLVGSAVSNNLASLYRADVMKIHSLCAATGANFKLVAIPQDCPVTVSSMVFDPAELRRLYDLGKAMSVRGIDWRTTPPGAAAGERTPVRTGVGPTVR